MNFIVYRLGFSFNGR